MAMTIKQKQWQLYFLDCYDSCIMNIDGDWGDGSVIATKTFQRLFGLEEDGVFGPITEGKSKEVIKKIQTAAKAYTPGLVVDGLAGWNTVTATKKMQQALGLKADGIAGKLTRAKLDGVDVADTNVGHTEKDNDVPNKTGTFWDAIKYFTKGEFKCHCGGKYCNGFQAEPQEKLVRAADKVREHFGAPATVSSGCRCTRHNSAVGGVSNSRHLSGKAMDFCIRGKSSAQVLAFVQTLPEIRYAYAIDGSYVHMDIL